MLNKTYRRKLARRIAILAASPSALRNQGTGIVSCSQDFLVRLKISKFLVSRREDFIRKLDSETCSMKKAGAKNWGTARKALNLFLRDMLYNAYLRPYYHLAKIESWLEIPLDSYTMKEIRKKWPFKCVQPPRLSTIKNLSPEDSASFQRGAQAIAEKKRIARIHLDLDFWRTEKSNQKRNRTRR